MTARDAAPELGAHAPSNTEFADARGLRLIYLAFDSNDSRVLHRARTLENTGADLVVAGFRRDRTPAISRGNWESLDLGRTVDEDYANRILGIFRGAYILWRKRASLRNTQGIISRNIEQFLLARVIQLFARKRIPIAYECLDIHHLMIKKGVVSALFRATERWCLRHCDLLIVSSPAYIEEYFKPTQGFHGKWQLIENKLGPQFTLTPRPAKRSAPTQRPLRIGWFGILRCARSFEMLLQIADARPNDVEIIIRGIQGSSAVEDFQQRIDARPNVEYLGPYKNPDDLASLYDDVDVTWAIDYFEEGGCSEWLLPNRLYESGYFGVPMLTRSGTATADYVRESGIGWSIEEPVAEQAIKLIDAMDEQKYEVVSERIANLPLSAWVEKDEVRNLIGRLVSGSASSFTQPAMPMRTLGGRSQQGD
jgi:succinoglycan biosynthesis protein ExoL